MKDKGRFQLSLIIAIFTLLLILLAGLLGMSYRNMISVEAEYQGAYDELTIHSNTIDRVMAESAMIFEAVAKDPPDIKKVLFETRIINIHLNSVRHFDESKIRPLMINDPADLTGDMAATLADYRKATTKFQQAYKSLLGALKNARCRRKGSRIGIIFQFAWPGSENMQSTQYFSTSCRILFQ